jgi:hypothetical protein
LGRTTAAVSINGTYDALEIRIIDRPNFHGLVSEYLIRVTDAATNEVNLEPPSVRIASAEELSCYARTIPVDAMNEQSASSLGARHRSMARALRDAPQTARALKVSVSRDLESIIVDQQSKQSSSLFKTLFRDHHGAGALRLETGDQSLLEAAVWLEDGVSLKDLVHGFGSLLPAISRGYDIHKKRPAIAWRTANREGYIVLCCDGGVILIDEKVVCLELPKAAGVVHRLN